MNWSEAEPETVHLLAALVKMLKPRYVVETGTFHGTTAKAMADSLSVGGHVHTIDKEPVEIDHPNVTTHHMKSEDFVPSEPINLAFIDSGIGDTRMRELEMFRSQMAPGGVVCFHDSELLTDTDGWSVIRLPNLTLLQRI